jgi:hypothetical protein
VTGGGAQVGVGDDAAELGQFNGGVLDWLDPQPVGAGVEADLECGARLTCSWTEPAPEQVGQLVALPPCGGARRYRTPS